MFDLLSWKDNHCLDEIVSINISSLSAKETRGYHTAILLMKSLPKEYIHNLIEDKSNESVFVEVGSKVDALADKLAEDIVKEGYRAIAQSDRGLGERKEFDVETKTTILPHKTIAVLSGIGWIGKNNLLVTERYGCALCMCSVLTDAPVETKKTTIVTSKCGNCSLCVKECPVDVLHGNTWTLHTSRDEIVDVYHCQMCLKCMAKCKYSQIFARL